MFRLFDEISKDRTISRKSIRYVESFVNTSNVLLIRRNLNRDYFKSI